MSVLPVLSGRGRRVAMLGVTLLAGLVAFTWPLFVVPAEGMDRTTLGPLLFGVMLPMVLAITIAEFSADGLSPRALAMLGVLSALGALARPLGAGTAGVELVFVLIILGGRVFGPAFGFLLGAITMLASALITGGVGPWLPYQMIAAGFIGLGAGLLPHLRGVAEIVWLCAFGLVAAFTYGWLMDLAFWPFTLGPGTAASYVPGAPILENLHRFVVYNVATSMGWNLGRAISNVVALAVLGPPLLRVLRRTTRVAVFDAPAPEPASPR
ncbi:ECF transporter S component [Propioniferax innocua]|uniref:Energy-coupling factor transport system substrate-specific component n=1 Tax=Propioniferax innocua TaxID=1753 RepID=A0A542ZSB3_9ACTN|nr:ECF transporter S component [Propioniferax innocua]TQL63244.1 energy-coupling factor transport system substrate-specific component [Propioniferax innocua]